MIDHKLPHGLTITGSLKPGYEDVLTEDALKFIVALQREFSDRRSELLNRRIKIQRQLDEGRLPDFLPETQAIREDPSWQVGSIPADLQKRHVEITGPVERKMMINALNSGADVFMADFEDANSPTWDNVMQGHLNLRDAIARTIAFTSPDGKKVYKLNAQPAVLMVRPRGWHLLEKHILLDGAPISASLADFGLHFYHNAKKLLEIGSGPYFYLPKLENHLEARLWNDVFVFAQNTLSLPVGTIKATVLIETILNAFEMEEVLYELRDHIVGLNAGRWDYIFSAIKKLHKYISNPKGFKNPLGFMPDRDQITMAVPFMRTYAELLIQTCHKRGAHAIGGMSAFIPSRKDENVNRTALAKVREDKLRESSQGNDGCWVAHPDLVPFVKGIFNDVLGDRPHQKDKLRGDVRVTAADLLNFTVEGGKITEYGIRHNINVGLLYLEAWLTGTGAAAIYNLMEDVATCEISRTQLWHWLHNPNALLDDGRTISAALVKALTDEELGKIKNVVGAEAFAKGKFDLARRIFDELIYADEPADFLTLKAYEYL